MTGRTGTVAAERAIVTVRWRTGRLSLHCTDRVTGVSTRLSGPDVEVAPDARYRVTLAAGIGACGWLGTPGAWPAMWRLEGGGTGIQPVPLPPGISPDASTFHFHPGGRVTVVSDGRVFQRGPELHWQVLEIPDDMVVGDVSVDGQGRLWAVGTERQREGMRRRLPVVYYQAGPGAPFVERPLQFGPLRGYLTRHLGGLESIDSVDVSSPPFILMADSAHFAERPAAYILVLKSQDRDSLYTLPAQRVCRVLRPGPDEAWVLGTAGDMLQLGSAGRVATLRHGRSLRAALEAACPQYPGQSVLVVRGASLDAHTLYVVAGLHTTQAGRLVWRVCALCTSRDSGSSWDVLEATLPDCGDEEMLDVAVLGV